MTLIKGLSITVLCVYISGCGGGGAADDPPVTSSSSYSSSSIFYQPTIVVGTSPFWTSAPALKDLASFPIGMEVSAANEDRSIFTLTNQLPTINKHFNSLVAGVIMKMRYLHPGQDEFFYTDADNLSNYAATHGMLLHGHTLIWHWDSEIPAWMKSYSGDWEQMLNNHVNQICRHFAGRVSSWDVVNEAIDPNSASGFRESIFYWNVGKKYIENAYITARQADPNAVLYYNEFGMESSQKKLDLMLAMLDDFKARNIPVDGVGFQLHLGLTNPPIEQIKAAFKAVADRGYKIRISELDMPIGGTSNSTVFTEAIALQQGARYKAIVKAYLEAVPAGQRTGITFWGLVDGESWYNYIGLAHPEWPLLFNDDYSPKPAFYGVAEALAGY